jgi:CRP-like cAMP-binding protein
MALGWNGTNKPLKLASGHFLGEISFLLGSEASATIIAKPGCSYVSWNVDTLKDLMSKKPHIASAVSVLLKKDLTGQI